MGKILDDQAVMSLEEFRISRLTDEIVNVHTMGAIAFVLFSGNDRSPGAWPLPTESYAVIIRVVSEERSGWKQSNR